MWEAIGNIIDLSTIRHNFVYLKITGIRQNDKIILHITQSGRHKKVRLISEQLNLKIFIIVKDSTANWYNPTWKNQFTCNRL